ncbi:hypothetical protein [Agromyces aureus]|uniref:Uncharacterized protein n=1 Tax=Agromyces aureus TaxID=453304 RepID=A0A191WEV4_9MICO|nr:hypothetical protein [Agromyces aureus]ANJ26791.1 hypothetical protein ATC03_08760 [Agromyces aureus]
MKRDTRTAYRARAKATEAHVDAAVAEVKADRDAKYETARTASRLAEAQRVRFTAADLADATHVRTTLGWHEVVRVNAKTVTVKTAYSWDDRVLISKILEHRKVTS